MNAAQIDLIVEGKVDKNGREDVNKKLIAMNSAPSKGQLISECLFEKIVWTKIPTKNLIDSAQQRLLLQG